MIWAGSKTGAYKIHFSLAFRLNALIGLGNRRFNINLKTFLCLNSPNLKSRFKITKYFSPKKKSSHRWLLSWYPYWYWDYVWLYSFLFYPVAFTIAWWEEQYLKISPKRDTNIFKMFKCISTAPRLVAIQTFCQELLMHFKCARSFNVTLLQYTTCTDLK